MSKVTPPAKSEKTSPERLPLRWAVIGMAAAVVATVASTAGVLVAIGAGLGTAATLHKMIM